MSAAWINRRLGALTALIVVLAVAPLVFPDRELLTLMIGLLFGVYLGVCWNIVGGLAGPHSLGHSMFVGIGAYTSTVLFLHAHLTPWAGMFLGALVSAGFAAALGYLTLRQRVAGPYFLMLTLAVSLMLGALVDTIDFVGGPSGLALPFLGDAPQSMQFRGLTPYYYLIAVLLVVGIGVTELLKSGRSGYAFRAMKMDEPTAAASGVNILRYRTTAFAVSAFMTAFAGTFYAQYYQYLTGTTVFGLDLSLRAMVFPIVGGLTSTYGPLWGGLLLYSAAQILQRTVGSAINGLDDLVYGVALAIVMMAFPGGLASVWSTARARSAGSRRRTRPQVKEVENREDVSGRSELQSTTTTDEEMTV